MQLLCTNIYQFEQFLKSNTRHSELSVHANILNMTGFHSLTVILLLSPDMQTSMYIMS